MEAFASYLDEFGIMMGSLIWAFELQLCGGSRIMHKALVLIAGASA